MNNKQLYEKLGQNSYDKVFPITYLQNILDKDTNYLMYVPITTFNIGYPVERPWKRLP